MAKKSGRKSSKSKRVAAKPVIKSPSLDKKTVKQPRTIKPKPAKGWRRLKPPKHPVKLPSSFKITKHAYRIVADNRKLFLGISFVYGVLYYALVRSQSVISSVSDLKSSFDKTIGGHPNSIVSGTGTFLNLLGSSSSSSAAATPTYQLLLLIIASLAIIWALRQVMAGATVRIRDSYYKGMYPLIPSVLILLVVFVEVLPMALASSLYGEVITGNIATTTLPKSVWLLIFIVFSIVSLYLISSSLFALYLVTLPDMTPIKALKAARQMVRGRRWVVLRKVLFLPLLLLVVAGVIVIPIIILLPAVADWVYFLFLILAPLAVNAYMYTLYRELLSE